MNIGRITGLRWHTIRNVEPDSGDRGGGRKCDRATNTGQPEDETQNAREPHYTKRERRKLLAILYASHLGEGGDRGGRTGTNRGAPASVDFVEKLRTWDSAVATKCVHHA